uniref:Uncharacterized protein n=1 Tax=Fundulus heteroclitus TaxID=8078 RepID=A0A146S536_FUNHE
MLPIPALGEAAARRLLLLMDSFLRVSILVTPRRNLSISSVTSYFLQPCLRIVHQAGLSIFLETILLTPAANTVLRSLLPLPCALAGGLVYTLQKLN